MIQEIRKLSRADRIRRGSSNWIFPVAGTIGLLAAVAFVILKK